MSSESFNPRSLEYKEVEDVITEKQKIMSSLREKDYEALTEEMLLELEGGKYDLQMETKKKHRVERTEGFSDDIYLTLDNIKGTIGDKEINITSTEVKNINRFNGGGSTGWEYSGHVEGEEISWELAREIFRKYIGVSRLQDSGKKGFLGIGAKDSLYEEEADREIRRREKIAEQIKADKIMSEVVAHAEILRTNNEEDRRNREDQIKKDLL